MADVKDIQTDKPIFLTQLDRLAQQQAAGAGSWFLPRRKAAIARFSELGFPTIKDEAWRSTNIAPIARGDFGRADDTAVAPSISDIAPFSMRDEVAVELVFINGRFDAALSYMVETPPGLRIISLREAIESEDEVVRSHLARYASDERNALVALNTALMEDGVLLHIPRNVVVDRPIHVLYLSTPTGAGPTETGVATHPRSLIVAEANAQATIVETYASVDGGEYWTNAVTEIVAGENAVLDHYRVERESDAAYHTATLQIQQDRSSRVASHALTFGGKLVRHDINTVLGGEGAHCNLRGLYMIRDAQHVDNHLNVDHAKPHCDSREFFKGILSDRSRGVFSGRIVVREGAQKTDAKQTNRSLLLSSDAQVDSQPQLEILADDVKCTHGATIGQVDDAAQFYLQSRGLPADAARSLLVYAFARESVSEIKVAPLRERLELLLLDRLPHGELLRE